MVQPHRACSSGATSHHASGTMRQDASANKNKPRHSAYSDAAMSCRDFDLNSYNSQINYQPDSQRVAESERMDGGL